MSAQVRCADPDATACDAGLPCHPAMMAMVSTTRSTDISTRVGAARVYLGRGSARVLVVAAVAIVTARVTVGGFGRGDVIVIGVTIAITGPVEWVIHRWLLHASEDAWTSRALGTGSGHRRHHLDPPDIDWLMLPGVDAAIFVAAFGVVTGAWTVPLMWMTGSAQIGPFLTAWACVALGLAHYEWVHLLVHTRYRCRSRYYRRLARNHRLHHYRNEHYWLGVTANSGDRLLGTYPKDKTDVPYSATARSLDTQPDPIG